MVSIETYTEEENSENNFARFFDKNGNPVPKSHVYCKIDGTPYQLVDDEDGQLKMTKERLIEVKRFRSNEENPISSSSD